MNLVLLLIAATMNAGANACIKLGMTRLGTLSELSLFDIAKKAIINPWLFLGVALFVGTLGAYAVLLSKMNLSLAYPLMTSIGFLLVTLFSIFILSERLVASQWLGLLAIVLGIWLTARPA